MTRGRRCARALAPTCEGARSTKARCRCGSRFFSQLLSVPVCMGLDNVVFAPNINSVGLLPFATSVHVSRRTVRHCFVRRTFAVRQKVRRIGEGGKLFVGCVFGRLLRNCKNYYVSGGKVGVVGVVSVGLLFTVVIFVPNRTRWMRGFLRRRSTANRGVRGSTRSANRTNGTNGRIGTSCRKFFFKRPLTSCSGACGTIR